MLGCGEEVEDPVDRLRRVQVCSVESTRWPVSAAASAVRTFASSRISPIRSRPGPGAARGAARLRRCGVGADLTLLDDRALVAVDELDRSSIVTMCLKRVWLMCSIIAASVVDLPAPLDP